MKNKFLLHLPLVTLFIPGLGVTAPEFEEVTTSAGFTYTGETWGASWGDLNSDGRPDLYTNNHRAVASVYLNNGDGTFTDVGVAVDIDGTWSADPISDTHGATWADFDNDGDQDLFISNGYTREWEFMVNEGGVLDTRTADFGFSRMSSSGGRFAGWLDYNDDGLLDVMSFFSRASAHLYRQSAGTFVDTATSYHSCERNHYMLLSDINVDGRTDLICVGKNAFPDRIYDTSTLPFSDISSIIPVTNLTQDTAIADFNNDLRPDVFNVRGGKRLSDATLVGDQRVEAQLIVDSGKEKSFSFINDGILSVVMSWEGQNTTNKVWIGSGSLHPSDFAFLLDPSDPAVWGIRAHNRLTDRGVYIGYDVASKTWQVMNSSGGRWNATSYEVDSTAPISNLVVTGLAGYELGKPPVLFMNYASGFQDETKAAGLKPSLSCVSVTAGDFDNDMDNDLYLVCREGVSNIVNRLYENKYEIKGKAEFVQVTAAGGAEGVIGPHIASGAGTGESVVTADYDSDGFLDLFVTNGLNMSDARIGGPVQLFRNKGNLNHWIELDLEGTISNRDGLGAKVFATANEVTQLREQNGGYSRWSQNHQRIHFGLAGNTTVDVRVEWPSGTVDEHTITAVDSIYRVVEGGGVSIVDFPVAKPTPCGAPDYNAATDNVIVLWQDCPSETWKMLALPGGTAITASGSVVSDQPFVNVTPVSVEAKDTFDTTDPTMIVYSLTAKNIYKDGFNFTPAANASVCFGVGAPPGTTVLLGADNTPMSLPLDLVTLEPCT